MRQRGGPWASPDGRDGAAPVRPSIPPDMAYSGRRSTPTNPRLARDPCPLGIPVHRLQPRTTSRTSSIRPGSPSLVLLVVLGDPLLRPDAGPPPPPALSRHVGVAVVGGPDHVQPADHRIAVRVRLLPRPRDRDHRARRRSSGSASCASRRSSAAYETRLARERYFTKQKFADPEATIRRQRRRPPPASGSDAGCR